MAKNPTSQLSLDALFDSTAISSLTLDGGYSRLPRAATVEEAPLFRALKPAVAQARNWRLRGSRDLAPGWKERAADAKRGFSAYLWIRNELIRLGVPREQIAFMQDYKRAAAKQGLFNDMKSGRVRILLGSTQTMGTGVNAQLRLKALHHLDVPWLPSDIEQREGRIERQGNQNEEIDMYAYATLGSVDATQWQQLERKARFIAAALGGDRTIRRLEDVDSNVNQFAMAKALASGDQRLMRKAGIEAELARLERLRAAHIDDQHAIAREIRAAESTIIGAGKRIVEIEQDLAVRTATRGDAFTMRVGAKTISERKTAGGSLLSRLRLIERNREEGTWTMGAIGGFEIKAQGRLHEHDQHSLEAWLERTNCEQGIELSPDLTALGLIARLEYMVERFEVELTKQRRRITDAEQRLPGYRQRQGQAFALQDELTAKRDELAELEADLAANDKGGEGEAQDDAQAA